VAVDFYRVSFVYKKYKVEQVVDIFEKLQKFEDVSVYHKGNLVGKIL